MSQLIKYTIDFAVQFVEHYRSKHWNRARLFATKSGRFSIPKSQTNGPKLTKPTNKKSTTWKDIIDSLKSSLQLETKSVMSAVTIDPLIRLRPSAELTQFIQYLHNDHPDLAMAESLAGKDLLTVQDIRWVYDQRHLLKDRDDSGVHFHDLMSDCQMVGVLLDWRKKESWS